jgi:AcrR family transcriptional regulator
MTAAVASVKIQATVMSDQKRPYRMKQRAESQDATRLRLTESAVALHEALGPACTTMAMVAEHAGVQRSTLYRHFADEAALFEACSAHWYARHPRPDLDRWRRVVDPDERLVGVLGDLYGWYRSTGTMLDVLIRDEGLVPSVAERFRGFHMFLAATHDLLMGGRRLRGSGRERTGAAIGLALRFETWRSLCRDGGLEEDEAVTLLARLVAAARQP